MQVCYPSYPELTPLEDLRLAIFYLCLLLSDADWSSLISDFLLWKNLQLLYLTFASSYVINSLIQVTQNEVQTQKNENIGRDMEAILSLDDGRWSQLEEDMPPAIIRQPVCIYILLLLLSYFTISVLFSGSLFTCSAMMMY